MKNLFEISVSHAQKAYNLLGDRRSLKSIVWTTTNTFEAEDGLEDEIYDIFKEHSIEYNVCEEL